MMFDKLLNDLYHVQKNFDGASELHRKAKLLNKSITKDDVKVWLQ